MAWTFVMNTGYCWLVWKNKRINFFVGLFVLSWPHSVSAEYKAVILAEYSVSAESEIYGFGRPLVADELFNSISKLPTQITEVLREQARSTMQGYLVSFVLNWLWSYIRFYYNMQHSATARFVENIVMSRRHSRFFSKITEVDSTRQNHRRREIISLVTIMTDLLI